MFDFEDIPKLTEQFLKDWAKKRNFKHAEYQGSHKHRGYLPDGRYMNNLLDDQDYYNHYGEKGYRQ